MKESLDKFIKRLVFRKYPFIKDYEIIVDTFRPFVLNSKKIGSEVYRFEYTVSPDENGKFPYNSDFYKIAELTETLFKTLGPKDYQSFGGVKFYSNED
jgi:hypothetical protein